MEDIGGCNHSLSLTSLSSDTSGIWNRRRSDLTAIATTATGDESSPITGRPGFSSGSVGIKPSDAHPGYVNRYLGAAITIQRAFRRSLARKRASNNVSNSDIGATKCQSISTLHKGIEQGPLSATAGSDTTKEKVDMEVLQQTCRRQSAEIDQLKELMNKLLLEAEEDRCKLRQRDKEIEDLMKNHQKLAQSVSWASGLDMSSASSAHLININLRSTTKYDSGQSGPSSTTVATFATVPSLNTLGLDNDSSSAETLDNNDPYEIGLSYNNSVCGNSGIHPLSSLPSRSNSITGLQSRSHQQSLAGLKINQASNLSLLYQQQHKGVVITDMDSPSSEYPSQEMASMFNGNNGRSLAEFHPYQHQQHQPYHHQQHGGGYHPQSNFHTLSHRHSAGSFASSSGRGFDSAATEQPTSYPWNVPAAAMTGNLSHSQSWADDISSGYGSVSSPGQYQHGGVAHSGTFDPNLIHQYPHSQQQQQLQQQQGLPPHRHNHRGHSDKSVHLDYQMCVDRILHATDQQASIHLQQKLKTSPPDQKIQIIDSILGGGQAYSLMCNRFGNFLIQRCFEFGAPQQIESLAQAMRGNILTLACDSFGCHVVQKALDTVEEGCKARIVTEMFRRIPETIVHRYACHVWQKVFEIRWMDSPPAVMTYVNNAVAGKWPNVAMNETGSLVVQNIFENCPEHDKRPVLNEILQSVTTIAKGQWGNWVIQHILEHGAPVDRAIVTQKILEDAVNLSLDQYASKVVEKTLRTAAQNSSIIAASSLVAVTTNGLSVNGSSDKNKDSGTDNNNNNAMASGYGNGIESTGPPTFTVNGMTIRLTQEEVMTQYIGIVCDGVLDRPRIPLIDIAADQYGNYIVQHILTNAGPQHREMCAALIRRHMVSLRGSKYGQKVAFMVERWRGGPFSNNNNNNNNNNNSSSSSSSSSGGSGGNNSHGNSSGHGSYGSKTGSMDGSNGGANGGRRRW
ncbi:hypothetical protein BGX34_003725 [Mortierella sp. NVP85]|nr:hypothetical protein BGX34_003725 [Mortierella sp. NVP85]